jgi:hypothetical protein
VTVRLRGDTYRGNADVIEDDEAVADYVRGFIERHGLDSVNRLALAFDGDTILEKRHLLLAFPTLLCSPSNLPLRMINRQPICNPYY